MKSLLCSGALLILLAWALIGCEHENVPAGAAPPPPPTAEKAPARTYDYSHTVVTAQRKGGRKITVAILRFGDSREVPQTPFGNDQPATQPSPAQVAVNVQVGDNVAPGPTETPPQISKRSREELKHELVKSEFFTVVERERILEILREVNFGQTRYVDEKTAAQEGQILAVRYLIEGSLGYNEDRSLKDELDKTTYKDDDYREPGALDNIFAPARSNRERMAQSLRRLEQQRAEASKRRKASTACYLSVYEVSTGEVVATVVGLGANNLEAIQEAVDDLVADLSARKDDIRVAAVAEDAVYIDVGANGGVKSGDRYQVVHLGDAIRDREGAVIGHQESEVGEIEVTEARDQLGVCKVITKAGTMARGDVVKPAKH